MQPRPLYRWKSFWLGVFVLVFLGWVWVRSTKVIDTFDFAWSGGGRVTIMQSEGVICVFWVVENPFASWPEITHNVEPNSGSSLTSRAFEYSSSPFETTIFVAYRLLMSLFIIPLAAFLAWRWRRMRRFPKKVP